MSDRLSFLPIEHHIVDGPLDVGVEQRWRLRLSDGTETLLGQLASDLARDVSIRRRYVRDVERLRTLAAPSLAPLLAHGPVPDPRDPAAVAPWRLRIEPPGHSLVELMQRAPVPLDEFAQVFAAVADAVHAVHTAGAVLRDLQPSQVRLTPDGRAVLVDVGLARVDVLSSHTASSLLMQGSSYAAPEQLLRTAVDQRADLYGVGVMMWQALTGELPQADDPMSALRPRALPSLRSIRPDAPELLDTLVRRCLDADPNRRPPSIAEIAWVLRGGSSAELDEVAKARCQHCTAALPLGQRLCVQCGRLAVRFVHASDKAGPRWALELVALDEEATPLQWLQDFLRSISRPPVRPPEFIIGSVHLYSEEERKGRIRLPARLFDNLTEDTANALHELMQAHGIKSRIIAPDREVNRAQKAAAMVSGATVVGSGLLTTIGLSAAFVAVPGALLCLGAFAHLMNKMSDRRTAAWFLLRPEPVALPASDPLVGRLASLLQSNPPTDVRTIVADMALLVQRLVDHRGRLFGHTAEFDMLTEPVRPLVDAVVERVDTLTGIERELHELSEGELVRALAIAEARPTGRDRGTMLDQLDHLRALEDRRAMVLHQLLEARALLQRSVHLGLQVHDPKERHEHEVRLALAMLDPG